MGGPVASNRFRNGNNFNRSAFVTKPLAQSVRSLGQLSHWLSDIADVCYAQSVRQIEPIAMIDIPFTAVTDLEALKARLAPPEKHHIVFLVLPGVQMLDLAGPAQVFHTANRLGAGYCLTFCATTEQVTSAQGLTFTALSPLPDLTERTNATQVLVAGITSEDGALMRRVLDDATREWLQRAYHIGLPIASVCTGAFALAEAGLLDNKRCTTHWLDIVHLQQSYPLARVLDNLLFVQDGTITTSAGIASGIDMALWMVEQEFGALFAAQIARCMVVYLRRNGAQPQNSVFLEYRTHLDSDVHRAQDFILGHATERLTLDHIAHAAHLSNRNLSRLFKEATGLTPVQYQQRIRLALAQTLMGDTRLSVDAIAVKCGFEDARHFRRLWKARYGSAPSESRAEMNNLSA